MKKVEQVLDGEVILDFDNKKSSKEILKILKKHFKEVSNENSKFKINIDGEELTFLLKNVTYLGHPHPLYTKRIQLNNLWEEDLKNKNTFLMGIYNYNSTTLFVHFDKKNYVGRNLNNSSAHVWVNDLLRGYKDGVFQKVDSRKNEIFVIREDKLEEFVKSKFLNDKKIFTDEIEMFSNFKNTIGKKWRGVDCYNEMIINNYNNKFQSEWPGFYLEFKFEKFLTLNQKYKEICDFLKNKKKEGIDFDIWFKSGYYGDLKTHSKSSTAILGNDQRNINSVLEKYNRLWYVVLNISPTMDKNKNYEVTHFWNMCREKSNLDSYGEKMKNSVDLISLEILEINNYNKKYLSDFNQGINSNGRVRKPKYKINSNLVSNFKIYDFEL
ncbi:MAG: hypothetical protein ACLFPL_03730 [Candidatus Nanoarchaeia archaeon]